MTEDEMLAEIARLKKENEKLNLLNASLSNDFHTKLQKAFKEHPDAFPVVNEKDLNN